VRPTEPTPAPAPVPHASAELAQPVGLMLRARLNCSKIAEIFRSMTYRQLGFKSDKVFPLLALGFGFIAWISIKSARSTRK